MSSPRRPRFRRSLSELSAIPWSSWRTNRGTISGWSMTRVSATSAIRPSMTTEVSRTKGRLPLTSLENSMYGMMNRKSSFVWRSVLTQA